MPRVKRSIHARKKRRGILKLAKGYFGARSRLYRTATEAVERAMKYSYRDRRVRKRDFRKLWIARINAAARMNGITYSRFISGIKTLELIWIERYLRNWPSMIPEHFSRIACIAKGE